ncbi:MAG: hypothetical protein R3A45_02495 [Bdellovibrionota bacterium]
MFEYTTFLLTRIDPFECLNWLDFVGRYNDDEYLAVIQRKFMVHFARAFIAGWSLWFFNDVIIYTAQPSKHSGLGYIDIAYEPFYIMSGVGTSAEGRVGLFSTGCWSLMHFDVCQGLFYLI